MSIWKHLAIQIGVALGILLTQGPLWAAGQESLLPTLQALRQDYPTPMSHEHRGSLLNHAAWLHRNDGWGLLRKEGGNRCPTPGGVDVSCDYLVYRPTMQGFDVLFDENTPVWNQGDNFAKESHRWVAPVPPAGHAPAPVPAPTPTPVPTPDPDPEPIPTVDLSPVLNQGEVILAEVRAMRAELQEFRKAVGSWRKELLEFLGTKVAPIVGALLAGLKLGG